ncbi:MAG TPA: nicotinate phosphoribosyltransferase, partial [Dehalococcoidia bacterium]|nr:nicotinate phosphoribosyltransferase [Dehalococcoidia bacterium]
MREGEGLFTDLYELTMCQAYFNEGLEQDAVFDLYVRSLPPQRNFLIACGLDQVLSYLEALSFDQAALEYLRSRGLFSEPFLEYLSTLRFTGSVRAVPEGTAVFAGEPILEVTAPIPQAQIVETYLLNQVTFQTIIASKGARAVIAARGRTLVDFGSRRAHGSDAALKAARALYIAGYDSTSNVLAGREYGIPVAGTMAHSYIEAHESEVEAFRAFLRSYPETVLLVDTYDTMEGLRRVAALAAEQGGLRIRGVRLDSGDMGALAKAARQVLDDAGLRAAGIFGSGGMDEYEIDALLSAGAPFTAFGVGTAATVSSDAPALDSAYKLVAFAGRPRMKLSPEKATLPGPKQVFRRLEHGRFAGDVIALASESLPGEPLMVEVMHAGRRTAAGASSLEEARAR